MGISFLFSIVLAVASAKPACTLDGMTDQCRFFTESNQSEFVLPDGTRFPNPARPGNPPIPQTQGGGYGPFGSTDPKAMLEMTDQAYEAQTEILMTISETGVNPKFALAATNMVNLSMYGASTAGSYPSSSTLFLPWPPWGERATTRAVSLADYKKEFIDKLTPEQKAVFDEQAAKVLRAMSAGAPKPDAPPPAPALSAERIKKVHSLADETKELLLSEMLRGRRYESLSADEKALYDKVQKIKMVDPTNSSLQNNPVCQQQTPNAFYLTSDNSISICPNFYQYPNSVLVKVLAHEMAHSIDPCSCSLGHYSIDYQAASAVEDGAPRSELTQVIMALSEGRFWALPDRLKEKAISQGWIREHAAAIPPTRYPYKVSLSCLEKRIDMLNATAADRQQMVRIQARAARAEGADPATAREQAARTAAKTFLNPNCPLSGGPGEGYAILSQVGEVMSDAWAAKVLGRYLEENPPKTDLEKKATIGFFAAGACSPTRPRGMVAGSMGHNHPFPRERLDEIFLAEPRVQAALGCQPPAGGNVCLRSIGTNSNSRSQRGAEGSESTAPVEGQR